MNTLMCSHELCLNSQKCSHELSHLLCPRVPSCALMRSPWQFCHEQSHSAFLERGFCMIPKSYTCVRDCSKTILAARDLNIQGWPSRTPITSSGRMSSRKFAPACQLPSTLWTSCSRRRASARRRSRRRTTPCGPFCPLIENLMF